MHCTIPLRDSVWLDITQHRNGAWVLHCTTPVGKGAGVTLADAGSASTTIRWLLVGAMQSESGLGE